MAHINWLGVILAAAAYFFLGFLWYQALFGKVWSRALGMKMDNPPTGSQMGKLLVKSFLGNLLTAIGIALLLSYAHGGDMMRCAKIGGVAGLTVAGGSMWMHYNWLGKSTTALAIDIGYATIGGAIAGAIIGAM
jgi:hypothetical protein